MRDTGTTAHEAAEDIFFGQMVMIWARWFLIAAGVILTLWTVDKATHVVIGTIPIVGLMGMNFYLHGRYLSGATRERGADNSRQLAGPGCNNRGRPPLAGAERTGQPVLHPVLPNSPGLRLCNAPKNHSGLHIRGPGGLCERVLVG